MRERDNLYHEFTAALSFKMEAVSRSRRSGVKLLSGLANERDSGALS